MAAFSAAPRRGPFVGGRPFEARDEMVFFGRDDEIRNLTQMWRQSRLTILHSHAGAGKTSLLRAGVVPRLKRGNARVLPIGHTTPTRVWPVAALPERNPYALALLSSWQEDDSATRAAGLSIDDFLRRQEGPDRQGRPAPTLAAIDHAEAFLRQAGSHEHDRCFFLDELFAAAAKRPRLRLLLSVRTDCLDELLRVVKSFGDLQYEELTLSPFTPEEAAEVVRLSIEATGFRPAPAEVKGMLDEIRTPRDRSGLPGTPAPAVDPELMQVVGARLWGEPPDRERFVGAPMETGVERALVHYCAGILASVAAEYELPPGQIHAWLRHAVLAERSPELSSAARATAATVQALEDRHLIKADRQYGLRRHVLRVPRLAGPIRRIDPATWRQTPADASALLQGALQADFAGELDRAGRLALQAADVSPPNDLRSRAAIESLLGNIAYEQRRLAEAAEHYGRAAEMFEAVRDSTAVGWLLAAAGRVALEQGNQNEAIDRLRAAVARSPHDLTLQTGLGQALWDVGEPHLALSVLNDVLARESDVPEARRTRGEILADLGFAESALRDIGQARSRWPQPSARVARALALATLSRMTEACTEVDGVVLDAADSGPVLLRAARVLEITGDVADAARLAVRAISAQNPPLHPHQVEAAKHLSGES
ncbi:tetratricopeptide repeat protein [Nonomuraea sp. NPDC050556]|uniref:nSTAND1 domain-containing NTPase n=1 Tax=Nonomuraea sp. NPDC050556 TaxID=3364369 RepID=UPI00378DC0B6